MTDQNTIAMWCEKTEGTEDAEAEFHVNFWHFSSKRHVNFFELGIMPDDPNKLESIKIFLPIQVERGDIKDLGPAFKSPNLAQGIFNESLSSTQSANGKCVKLCEGDSVFCQVHIFSNDSTNIDESELLLKRQGSGTLLTITRQALTSLGRQSDLPERGYFRLRVTLKYNHGRPFVKVIKPMDRAWNSGFESIEYIDCRMNEARTLPISVEDAFRAAPHGVAKTRLIAFLAVVPVVSSVTSSHTEWHKSRLLERQIWENYVPEGLAHGMVVYHWKKVFAEIEDHRFASFSAFVKMQTRKSGAIIISLYLLLAFLLGVIGSLTATFVQYLVSSGA